MQALQMAQHAKIIVSYQNLPFKAAYRVIRHKFGLQIGVLVAQQGHQAVRPRHLFQHVGEHEKLQRAGALLVACSHLLKQKQASVEKASAACLEQRHVRTRLQLIMSR